jgi:hypothetical protein
LSVMDMIIGESIFDEMPKIGGVDVHSCDYCCERAGTKYKCKSIIVCRMK